MTPMTPNDNDNDNDNDNIIPINSLKENDPLLLDKNHSINYTNNNNKNGTYGKPSVSSISKSNASERKESETSDESERNKKSREYNYKIFKYLDNYFEITARDSTIMREIRGGTVGFLTLAYIVLLNPQVLNVSGIPYEYAASSTCLASCIATLICGIFGNIPVGCGPGVGLSAYFSYGMIPQIISNNTPQFQPYLQGLFMAFLSGAIVFILTLPGIVTSIVNALPHFIKVATIVGMGLFLAFVGMVDVGLVKQSTGQGNAILELGDMSSWIIWLSLLNTLLIATLKYFKINGSLLVCIIVTSIIYFGISEKWPTKIIDFPKFMDPLSVLNFESISHLPIQTAFQSIISFVLILFLDVSGVTFAIAKLCGLAEQKETLISFQKSAFIGTSIGSMIAALLGCSPIIVCIETSSGAAAGARTGLSACVIAVYFLISMFLGPLFGDVPPSATSPVLVFIGTLMMGQVGQIAWDNMRIAIPAFFCIAMMPFTYSISNGLFFGVISFFLTWISTGQFLTKYNLFGFKKEESFDIKYGYSNVTNPIKMRDEMDYSDIINEYEPSLQKTHINAVNASDENKINTNTNNNGKTSYKL